MPNLGLEHLLLLLLLLFSSYVSLEYFLMPVQWYKLTIDILIEAYSKSKKRSHIVIKSGIHKIEEE